MSGRHFVSVIALEKLRVSYVTRVNVAGRAVVLTHTSDGVNAFDGTCTHADYKFVTSRLKDGREIECPFHGACFDARTGAAMSGPTKKPLECFDVEINDGIVSINAPWAMVDGA
jgi:nitrite reductase/ring-hydroxylating ferredoxin subunit